MSTATPHRWSFSLRGLLLLVLIVCLSLASLLAWRRADVAERELDRLRNEVGYLSIADRSLVNVISVPTNERNVWRWRLFIPKGYRYKWHVAHNNLPAEGVPSHGMTGDSNEPYWNRDNEVLVTASLRPKEDGDWLLLVTSRIGDSGEQMSGASLVIPQRDKEAMFTTGQELGENLGSKGTQVVDPKGPIVLLRRCACQTLPDGTIDRTTPMPGYMIWLQKW